MNNAYSFKTTTKNLDKFQFKFHVSNPNSSANLLQQCFVILIHYSMNFHKLKREKKETFSA